MLRYWAPSQYQGRFSLVESEWHGVTIPAGEPVFLLTGAAEPRRAGVRRTPTSSTSIVTIGLAVGFGHGIHVCIGAALARLETRTVLDEWSKRWPTFTVDEAGCRRVTMSNVWGYATLPVRVG